ARTGPFLDQPVVVGLYTGEFKLWVRETTERFTRPPRDDGIEDGVIHAIDVHGRQTLAGHVGDFGHFLPALRLTGAVGHRRSSPRHTREVDLLTIDHPLLCTICLTLEVGDTIAPPRLRHALSPNLWMFLHMIV